jgi:hypothetical protein
VDLEILHPDAAPESPEAIQSRKVPPGGRLKIGVAAWTGLETAIVRLTSSVPVIAERVSFSQVPQDVGTVLGFPLE